MTPPSGPRLHPNLMVGNRVRHADRPEGIQTQAAGVAAAAGGAGLVGVVATVGEAVVDAQLQTPSDDVDLAHRDERGVDLKPLGAGDAGLRGEIAHRFERGQELGAAVGVSRVIDAVDPDEEVEGSEDFRPGQGQREEDGVPRGDVGDRDPLGHVVEAAILGHVDVGRERAAAEGPQVDGLLHMTGDAH